MLNVLFLCTGNSARSIMAEAYLNRVASGRLRAYSAGSHPKGAVHPLTIETLRRAGLSTEGLRSRTWDEFGQPGAPKMDFVITVCDAAAGEALSDLAGPASENALELSRSCRLRRQPR
jgi:arsenate reductase